MHASDNSRTSTKKTLKTFALDTKVPIQVYLENSFREFPNRIAVEWGGFQVSYRELETRKSGLAARLLESGVEPGTFIGICLDNPIDLAASILAVLEIRCVFVVLDPVLPPRRLWTMIDIARIPLVMVDNVTAEWLSMDGSGNEILDEAGEVRQINLDRLEKPVAGECKPMEYLPRDPLYVYFTSGSTGRPKAFTGTNRGLVHFFKWQLETLDIREPIIVSQLTAPGFDAYLRDLFVPLLSGGTLSVPPGRETVIDSPALVRWIDSRAIGLIHCVPSLMALFNTPVLTKRHFLSLRFVFLSGEPIPPASLENWFNVFEERVRLVNLYGTSETTLAKTFYFVRPTDTRLPRIPAGQPLPDTWLHVLDEDLDPCDDDFVGDVFIQTGFRTLGYVGDEAATRERFIVNPLEDDPDADDLFHRTGDLGKFLDDGNLDVLGRADRQVKIRGVRVEPEEIENIMQAHESVQQAAVVPRRLSPGSTELSLCAYFTPASPGGETGSRDREETLRQYLRGELPAYMVPVHFMEVENMPLTRNGKIDRRALPDFSIMDGQEYVAPATELEKELTRTWSELLRLDESVIGVNSHFFRIGGHSLKATLMVERIHQRLNRKLPLVQVFKTPTIRGLAQYLEQAAPVEAADAETGETYMAIEPVEQKEYYPMSSAQKRLYFIQRFNSGSVAYNLPSPIELGPRPPMDKLRDFFLKLIERHESLRTSFIQLGDQPVQVITPFEDIEFDIEILPPFSGDGIKGTGEGGIGSVVREFARPFDLSRAPLFRVGITHDERDRYHLVMDFHHIITDGTSMGVFLRELYMLRDGLALPSLHLQYKDFSQWKAGIVQGSVKNSHRSYWLDAYSGELPVLQLPTDFPRPAVRGFEGTTVYFAFDANETREIYNMAAETGVTMYMALLAAYTLFLSKLGGQEDIIVGTPVAGRRHAQLQDIIGFFVNTLPMRNTPESGKTYDAFLEEVKTNSLQGFENQEFQFDDLVEQLNLPRDTGRNPIFDVMFNLLNQAQWDEDLSQVKDLVSPPYRHTEGTAKFDLNFTAAETAENIVFRVEYCRNLFIPETMERMIAYFRRIVLAMTDAKLRTRPMGEIQLISEDEKEKILFEFNNTAADYPGEVTINQWFETVAASCPGDTALVWASEAGNASDKDVNVDKDDGVEPGSPSMTYGQLNQNANRLARVLRKKGVTAGSIVGIVAERSFEMITGILAILKAGGAYLPIDVEYPPERKAYMIKDGAVRLLLTNLEKDALADPGASQGGADPSLDIVHLSDPGSYDPDASNLDDAVNTGSDPLYVIYTSGSTGAPKGVMLEQRNLVNLLKFQRQETSIDFSRVLQFATICFDVSFQEIFSTLTAGGALHLIASGDRTEVLKLSAIIGAHEIVTLFLPSSFFKLVFNEAQFVDMLPKCVKHIVAAGEQLVVPDLFRQYLKKNNITLHNHYGPTETHVVTALSLESDGDIPAVPSIGKPVGNTSILILDANMNLVPVGVTGELYIAGVQVGRGYLNNPELTKEKFIGEEARREKEEARSSKLIARREKEEARSSKLIACRVGKEEKLTGPNEPSFPTSCELRATSFLYRTGDVARWLPDGNILFMGRKDHQVKIRGFRVEPGEIEWWLLKHEKVKEVVVLSSQDSSGDDFLCAYVVGEGVVEDQVEEFNRELSGFLSQHIPAYMIPPVFMLIESIPLTSNGKVDRRALPVARLNISDKYTAPRNELEEQMAAIWADLLSLDKDKIGVFDDFFRLGGHSLKATALVARIHKHFNVELSLAEVFQAPTIDAICSRISVTGWVKNQPEEPEAEESDDMEEFII